MPAYHLPPEQTHALLQGRLCTLLRGPRLGRNRHAYVGEPIALYVGRAEAVRVDCTLRARVLLDANGVRLAATSAFEHRLDDHAPGLVLHWRNDSLLSCSRWLGHDGWQDLAAALANLHGRPPWDLELIGWRPLPPRALGQVIAAVQAKAA